MREMMVFFSPFLVQGEDTLSHVTRLAFLNVLAPRKEVGPLLFRLSIYPNSPLFLFTDG